MQTLAELIESFQLYAVCETCNRVEEVPIDQLIKTNGGDYPIDRIRMRLYCRECQSRSQALRIVYVGPNRKSASFRYCR
jgi:hypothetical protein